MALSWNEIKERAVKFSKEWENYSNEEADAKPFLVEFFKRNNIKIELDVVKEAIIDYHSDGKELMRKLAEKYGLDIENEKIIMN